LYLIFLILFGIAQSETSISKGAIQIRNQNKFQSKQTVRTKTPKPKVKEDSPLELDIKIARGSDLQYSDDDVNTSNWSLKAELVYTFIPFVQILGTFWQITDGERSYMPTSNLILQSPEAVAYSSWYQMTPKLKFLLPVNEDKLYSGYKGGLGLALQNDFKIYRDSISLREEVAYHKSFYPEPFDEEGEALPDFEVEIESALEIKFLKNLKLNISLLYGQEFDSEGFARAYINHIQELESSVNRFFSLGLGHQYGVPEAIYVEDESPKVINPPFANDASSEIYVFLRAVL
jgi:hypothetical protein